jgi:hypothetical protein
MIQKLAPRELAAAKVEIQSLYPAAWQQQQLNWQEIFPHLT